MVVFAIFNRCIDCGDGILKLCFSSSTFSIRGEPLESRLNCRIGITAWIASSFILNLEPCSFKLFKFFRIGCGTRLSNRSTKFAKASLCFAGKKLAPHFLARILDPNWHWHSPIFSAQFVHDFLRHSEIALLMRYFHSFLNELECATFNTANLILPNTRTRIVAKKFAKSCHSQRDTCSC